MHSLCPPLSVTQKDRMETDAARPQDSGQRRNFAHATHFVRDEEKQAAYTKWLHRQTGPSTDGSTSLDMNYSFPIISENKEFHLVQTPFLCAREPGVLQRVTKKIVAVETSSNTYGKYCVGLKFPRGDRFNRPIPGELLWRENMSSKTLEDVSADKSIQTRPLRFAVFEQAGSRSAAIVPVNGLWDCTRTMSPFQYQAKMSNGRQRQPDVDVYTDRMFRMMWRHMYSEQRSTLSGVTKDAADDVVHDTEKGRLATLTSNDDRGSRLDMPAIDILPWKWTPDDIPRPYHFRDPKEGTIRTSLRARDTLVTYDAKKPIPTHHAIPEKDRRRLKSHQPMVNKLRAKFQEEKMIGKSVLREFTNGTSIQDFQLRAFILSSMAYYYKDGPFIRNWIMHGFDPRKLENRSIAVWRQTVNLKCSPVLFGLGTSWGTLDIFSRGLTCAGQTLVGFNHFPLSGLVEECEELRSFVKNATLSSSCGPKGWFTDEDFNTIRALATRHVVALVKQVLEPGELDSALAKREAEEVITSGRDKRAKPTVTSSIDISDEDDSDSDDAFAIFEETSE